MKKLSDLKNKFQKKEKTENGSGRFAKCKMVATEFSNKFFCSLKDAVYPKDVTCDLCGNELVCKTRLRLCSECVAKLPMVEGRICLNCGSPIKNEADYCLRCQRKESVFKCNRAPLVYDGIAKNLIYKFKFGGKIYIADTLGALMSDTYISNGFQAEIIVFAPMTAKEVKKRGFNQAELLAQNIGNRLNLPMLPALEKIKDTSEQKQLKGKEREQNLEDAFVCKFMQIKGRRILFVDDVFTTGATANQCSKALLLAGAKEVLVLTAAVTPELNDSKGDKIGQ